MRVNSIPITKDQAKQVRAFLKQERALAADEIPTNWAWNKWPAEHAMNYQELNTWFTKGTNQMLQVKGTDEYRVPTENDVVWNNQIVGNNPDPGERDLLLQEAQAGDGGSMLRKAQGGDGD